MCSFPFRTENEAVVVMDKRGEVAKLVDTTTFHDIEDKEKCDCLEIINGENREWYSAMQKKIVEGMKNVAVE